MMENPRLNKDNIIKNIRNLFRLEKETKAINDRILRDIKNRFEYGQEENYYKPVRVTGADPEISKRGDALCRPPWLDDEENL